MVYDPKKQTLDPVRFMEVAKHLNPDEFQIIQDELHSMVDEMNWDSIQRLLDMLNTHNELDTHAQHSGYEVTTRDRDYYHVNAIRQDGKRSLVYLIDRKTNEVLDPSRKLAGTTHSVLMMYANNLGKPIPSKTLLEQILDEFTS